MTKLLTLAQAHEQLESIQTRRGQLLSDRSSLEARLPQLQRQVGQQYLRGDHTALREADKINSELRAIDAAVSVLNEQASEAQIELKQATARDLRNQAREKRAELEDLNAKTSVLLAELSKLEAVEFTHAILHCQPLAGMWVHPTKLTKEIEPWHAFWEMRPDMPGAQNIAAPRSRLLRLEIEKLELQAAEIEAAI